MIIALYQCPEPSTMEAGLATVDAALGQAAAAGVALLVMPEAYLPGYSRVGTAPATDWVGAEDTLAALCAKHGVALVIGLPRIAGDGLENTALALGPDGATLAQYAKIQLFGPVERGIYAPGDRYVTFDFEGVRFGLLICYDLEFPEHARALAGLGAEVILVPTANMRPFTNVNQFMVPARAAENAVTVVYANYCGAAGDLAYCGLSTIAGPDGFSLGQMAHAEGLCIATLPTGKWSEHGVPLSTQHEDLRTL